MTRHGRRTEDTTGERAFRSTIHAEEREEIDKHLDNEQRGMDVFWYEKTRLFWGRIAFWMVASLNIFFKMMKALFGLKFLRNSYDSALS